MTQPYIPAFTLAPKAPAAAPAPAADAAAPRTPRFIDDVAAGRVELPTIPQVVQSLIAALRSPDVDSREICSALSRDPVLSAKVLRVANSSYFGGRRSMASIDTAVAVIGIQALNRLIVACGVSATFEQVPGIDLAAFWHDALVTAVAASKLAPGLGADADEAYIAGLLHASGHLILCQSYPEIADAMFTGFAPVRGAELAAIETDAFGIAHAEVGALWVESLRFPAPVVTAIRRAALPAADLHEPLDLALGCACVLAAAVARGDDADAALPALPDRVRSRFSAAGGRADAAFRRVYELLQDTEPMI
jgi:HD-like signal output (HDOD) protein